MVFRNLLTYLFLLLPIICGDEFNLVDVNDRLCGDLEVENLESDLFSDIPNDKVLICYSSNLFTMINGVIAVEVETHKKTENDVLTVVVYEKSATVDTLVTRSDMLLTNSKKDISRIHLNVTSSGYQGYVLLIGRLSHTSNIKIRSIRLTPLWPDDDKNLSIIQESSDTATTMVTVPLPSVGVIVTPAPDGGTITVPFPTIGQLPTTTSMVTIPFPTIGSVASPGDTTVDPSTPITIPLPSVGEVVNPSPNTTIVTVPLPTIGQIPTTSPIVTIPIPSIGSVGPSEDTTIESTTLVTVPFPTIGQITTPAPEPTIVTVPFPTIGQIPTTTPIVTIPFPTIGSIATSEGTTVRPTTIVTVPFPTIGEITTPTSEATIVTVPFPTIGQIPTTTPIVTIPFPTVGSIATSQDTTIEPTTIVTVPFPTVGGIVTFPPATQNPQDTTPTIVTIPFPTVGEIATSEPITDTTTEKIEESTSHLEDEPVTTSGLSPFAIIMISIGSFAFVTITGFIAWYLLKSKNSLDIKSYV